MARRRERVAAMLGRVLGANGADAGLGADARYTPAGGGAAVDLRAMPAEADIAADPFGVRTIQTGRTFEILSALVAERPMKGATLALLDAEGAVTHTYTLVEPAISPDPLRLKWRCVTDEGVPA